MTAISTADVGTSSIIFNLSSMSFICTVDLDLVFCVVIILPEQSENGNSARTIYKYIIDGFKGKMFKKKLTTSLNDNNWGIFHQHT